MSARSYRAVREIRSAFFSSTSCAALNKSAIVEAHREGNTPPTHKEATMTSFAAANAAARSFPIHTVHGHEVAAGDLIGFRESISGEERFARYIRPLGNGRHFIAFDENDEMEGFNEIGRAHV